MAICDRFEPIHRMYPRFSVSCRTEGEPPFLLEISLLDSLDTDTSNAFVKSVESVLKDFPTIRRLRLNASKIRYLSSTGIGSFATLYMLSKAQGIDFFLVDPSPHVTMLLKLLGFEIFIPTIKTGETQ